MDEVIVTVMDPSGVVTSVSVAPDIVLAARALPHAPERYFVINDKAILLPLELLVQSRARSDGISRAVQLMVAAYNGRQERREPISVRSLSDGRYLVLDGNSTVTIAVAAGWPVVPCSIHTV